MEISENEPNLSDLLIEDWILDLAQLMNRDELRQRKRALLDGILPSDPHNHSDRKFRNILRWVRQQLRTTQKHMWRTNHFELNVIQGRTNSGAGTRRDNDHEIGFVEIGAADSAYRRGRRKSRALAVWDVIHEFGHVLIGDPTNEESVTLYGAQCSIEREENAWSIGWSEVTRQFPDLLTSNDRRSYEERKQECMEDYRRKHKPIT